MNFGPNAKLALDTIHQKPTIGIPSWTFHDMEWAHLDKVSGNQLGAYEKEPESVYMACQRVTSTCMIDQYIPKNPLTLQQNGFAHGSFSATTGVKEIIRDGLLIDSPEAMVEHMEKFYMPKLRKQIAEFNENRRVNDIITLEKHVQDEIFGSDLLKVPYGVASFPVFRYGWYGYENYFMGYVLYPEVCDQCFTLEADLALLNNKAVARAYLEGSLPPLLRLDFDMADSRGTLVDIKSLDTRWFPHFARCLEPLLKSPVKLIWHCDGNLMQMVPRLIEVGLKGFQGFQYEDGMDYEKICKMKTKDGDPLIIMAGVSVTRTLPYGTKDDVKKEIKWAVEHAPKTGFFLSSTSSITPGVPWENIKTFIEAREYYLNHGR
jgi:hypothetical protein